MEGRLEMPDCRLIGASESPAPTLGRLDKRSSPAPRPYERIVVMLVLSRKKNESIVINNDITIVVVEIRGDKVRLGVEAPKEVPVHRREVYDAIKRNEAVQSGTVAPADSNAANS
jgi:carbon storage regulator